ncbi:uncharacterized protein PITG_22898 [Phytophthora infestans T30-4]|uniref:Uncharacterized protein n=1 Tax=Phytophthora infestans (strain T30-4) TaxID=403677 RepID=D0NCR6_PHYIT|nr:uncharacterized protein PITG_22898 [Phytophthora infestans T30-4]EEY55780.1 conserved hypothetical protein [Phytophthora infestans T30-4]|eukprot:XP_002903356.1 conserved hypothetical protein [Phytophthora infestans T30-4]
MLTARLLAIANAIYTCAAGIPSVSNSQRDKFARGGYTAIRDTTELSVIMDRTLIGEVCDGPGVCSEGVSTAQRLYQPKLRQIGLLRSRQLPRSAMRLA